MNTPVPGAQAERGASLTHRVISFAATLPDDAKQVFADIYFHGKNKEQVCRERGWTGDMFDACHARIHRLFISARPARHLAAETAAAF